MSARWASSGGPTGSAQIGPAHGPAMRDSFLPDVWNGLRPGVCRRLENVSSGAFISQTSALAVVRPRTRKTAGEKGQRASPHGGGTVMGKGTMRAGGGTASPAPSVSSSRLTLLNPTALLDAVFLFSFLFLNLT